MWDLHIGNVYIIMIYAYEGEFPSLTLPQSRWLDMSAGNFIINVLPHSWIYE
jgi:hypothetical protein